jgi:hypothetical protein
MEVALVIVPDELEVFLLDRVLWGCRTHFCVQRCAT